MNTKYYMVSAASAAALFLAGCEPDPATVLQLGTDRIQVIGSGPSEALALESAITTANEQCAARGKEAFVLTTNTGYQGVDRNTALIVDALTNAAAIGTGTPGYSNSTSARYDDWRANLEVRCGPQPS